MSKQDISSQSQIDMRVFDDLFQVQKYQFHWGLSD